jgi:hypothetical protein
LRLRKQTASVRLKWLANTAIALMLEALSTSETSVNFYEIARRNITEDCHLHTLRRENLKSHLVW